MSRTIHHGQHTWSVPPRFRRHLNRRYRYWTKERIFHGEEDLIGPPHRDAGWLWW